MRFATLFVICACQCIGLAQGEAAMSVYDMYAQIKKLIKDETCEVGGRHKDGTEDFRGLNIVSEDAEISFGLKKDVRFTRYGDRSLKIRAESVTFTGEVHSTTTDAILKRVQSLEATNNGFINRMKKIEDTLKALAGDVAKRATTASLGDLTSSYASTKVKVAKCCGFPPGTITGKPATVTDPLLITAPPTGAPVKTTAKGTAATVVITAKVTGAPAGTTAKATTAKADTGKATAAATTTAKATTAKATTTPTTTVPTTTPTTTVPTTTTPTTTTNTKDGWKPVYKGLPSLVLKKTDAGWDVSNSEGALGKVKDKEEAFPLKVKEWKPLAHLMPELTASDAEGTVKVSPAGEVSAATSAKGSAVEVLPDILSFDEYSASLEASRSAKTETGFVKLKGVARLGGKTGFTADVDTTVDVTASSASIPLSHKGGWPVPIKVAKFTTPAFKTDLKLGADKKYISLHATAPLSSGTVALSSTVSFEKPTLDVTLEKETKTSDAKFTTKVKTGLRLGKATVIPLDLEIKASGGYDSDFKTSEPWMPSPKLPQLKSPLKGKFSVSSSGDVEVSAEFSKPVSFTLESGTGSMKQFTDFKVSGKLDKSKGFVVGVEGKVTLGNKPGLLMEAKGVFDGDEILLDTTHAGGWRALDDLDVDTPRMTGKLKFGDDDVFMDGLLYGSLSKKIPMIPGFLTLDPVDSKDKGPRFGVSMKQTLLKGDMKVTPFFDAKICIKLGKDKQCLPVKVEPKADDKAPLEKIYNIWGEWIGGDIKPLNALGKPFSEFVVIKGRADTPLGVNLEADIRAKTVGITMSATMKIDVPAFGKAVELKASSVGRIAKSGPSYALMGVLDGLVMPKPFGKVPPVTVVVATGDIPKVLITSTGTREDVSSGISIYWSGVSPVPKLCNSKLIFSFNVRSIRKFGGEVTCPLKKVFLEKTIKSINFVEMTEIVLGFSVVQDKTAKQTTMSLSAGFSIATGSSDCSGTSSACLDATIEAEISSVVAVPPAVSGQGVGAGISLRGAWIDPMGLRNFALINPSVAIGFLFPPGPVPPILKKLAFGITVMWKRPKQKKWPDELLDFKKWPSLTKAPDYTKHAGFLTTSIHFHFEATPHDAWYLPKGVPKFACKVVVSKMTLSDMANILLDVVDSFTTGKLPNLDLSFMDKFIAFEFYIDGMFSLIKTETFTPGFYLKAGATGNLFGMKFDFKIDVNALIPLTGKAMTAFVTNPLSILSTVGFKVSAYVSLPFGLGEASLVGVLSAKRFMIEAKIPLAALNLASAHILINYEVAKPKAFVLAVHSEINLGFFGKIEIGGRIDSKVVSLYGGIDLKFFGLRFCGNLQAQIDKTKKCYKTKKVKGKSVKKVVPCFFIQFDAMIKLGVLGTAKFLGRVENKGIRIKATLESDIEKAMQSVIKDAISAIFKKNKDSKIKEQITKYLSKIVSSFIPFKKVDFELDTISTPGKLSLELAFKVLGIDITFPKINIKIGKRRRLGGGTPGREYKHVEAYLAEYKRLHPEYDADESVLEDPFRRKLKSTIDCTKDTGGFKIKDLVDQISDAVNLPLLASKLKLCLPGLVKGVGKGERCASDNQCKDYKKFPGGLWCDRDGKPSGGITCTGRCSVRYKGGKKCPLMRDAACRADECTCQKCVNEKSKKLSHGNKCVNDGHCEGWCSGKASVGCVGTCRAFLKTGQSGCSGSISGKLNDYKCEGSRKCMCNTCTAANGRGPYGARCATNTQCDNGYCKGKTGGACTGRCTPFLKTGGDCSGSPLKTVNDDKCLGKRECICKRCSYENGRSSYGTKCKKDSHCEKGWCKGKTAGVCSGTCVPFVKTGGSCGGSITAKLNDYKCSRPDGLGACRKNKCYLLKKKGSKCGTDNNWECKSGDCKCKQWKYIVKCTGGWYCT